MDPGDNTEKIDLKTREQWLREEVKNHRANLFSLIQWGMAILAAIESSLYFVRRDIAQAMMKSQYVVPSQVLSKRQWLPGTSLLFIISVLFTLLTHNLLRRYFHYRAQLVIAAGRYSKIDDSPVKKRFMWAIVFFFFAFPFLDFSIWWGAH